mmetsp:Transcript_25186/g.22912  ORF Transcript_25186/g.22912 Transcript_25186/m.22912 type:complete len:83 (+) Transcript_25186:563-811(+)
MNKKSKSCCAVIECNTNENVNTIPIIIMKAIVNIPTSAATPRCSLETDNIFDAAIAELNRPIPIPVKNKTSSYHISLSYFFS